MAGHSILIVEDDPAWQKSFAELVHDAGFEPVVTSTYDDAVEALSRHAFCLALVDISLTFEDHLDRGGVDFLRKIVGRSPSLPAIVVTGYATIDLAIETFAELGVVQFFRKEAFDRRGFIGVVNEKVLRPNILDRLSGRERQVLALMAQGLTNQQIADELYVTINTVKKHGLSIYTKLEVNSRAAAVARAYGQRP